jgi:hypothetical protein
LNLEGLMDQQDLSQATPPEMPDSAGAVPEPLPASTPDQSQMLVSAPIILPTSTMATVSLVAGILGFTFAPVIASIVALVTGYSARNETRSVPPRASGDGMATAGIIMGWIQVGLVVVGFCCFVVFMLFVLGLAGSSFGRSR